MGPKQQHAPGPWSVIDHYDAYGINDADGEPVCEFWRKGSAANAANRALIAAAPELLEALNLAEGFIAGFEDDELQEGMPEMLAQIRTALAKATGDAA